MNFNKLKRILKIRQIFPVYFLFLRH